MTTATQTRAPAAHRPRWLVLAGWQITGQVLFFAGVLAAAIVLIAVVLAVISRSATPSYSAFQITVQAAPWLPFGVAIHFSTVWLNLQLAAGFTRRSAVKAAVATGFGTGLAVALMLLAVLWAEYLVYGWLGWTADRFNGRALFPEAPLGSQVWGLFLVMSAWTLGGTAVGLAYHRWGKAATVLLPVLLLPLAAVALLAIDPSTMWAPFSINRDGTVYTPADHGFGGMVGVALGVAMLALLVAAIHLLARRIPITGPRA